MEQDLTESLVPELEAPVEVLTPEEYVATLVKKAKGAAGRLSSLPADGGQESGPGGHG